jgi:hypothetical protein
VASDTAQDKPNLILPAVIIALFIPVAVGAWWYLNREPTAPAAPVLTADAKAYVRNLKLSGVEMKATANYTGAPLIEVTGKITNGGDRPLARVELNCVFYDINGQVVLRERVPIVRKLLKPGESTDFRMPFEGIPDSWNKALPQLVIADIAFE